ncbi:MAG: hypothetical protein JSS53_08570, partial [Proteobacteria bacterium]|nr:hypothetical protein [Pseudomonadota bacterium]
MLTDVMLTEFLKELAQLMSKKGWRDQEARNLLYYFILYTFDHELEPYLPYQMKKLNIGEPWLKDLFRLFEMVEGEEFREHCYFMLIYVLSDRDIEEIAVYLLTEFPLEQSTKNFLLAMVKYPGGNDNPENNNVKNDNAKSNEGRIRTVRKIFTSIFSRLLSLFQKNPKNDYQIVFLIEYLEPYILDDVLHENRLLKNKRYPWLPLSYLLFKSLSETNLDMFVAFLLEHGDKIKKFSMIAGFLCEPTHKDYFLKKWRMMLLEGNLNPLKLNQLLEIMESYFTSKIPSAKIDVLEKLYPEQIKRTLQLLLQLESLSTFLRGNNVLSRLITMISLKIQEQFLSQAAPLLNQIISLALEQPSLNPEDFDYNKVLSSIENFITQITTFHYPKEFEMVCSAFNQRLEDESLVSDAEISEQHRLDFIMKSFFIRIFSPDISTFLDNSHCTWEGKKDTTSDSREFIRKLLINIANIIQGKKSDNASLQELTNDTTRLSILNFIGEMAGVAPLPTLNSTTFASATYTTP